MSHLALRTPHLVHGGQSALALIILIGGIVLFTGTTLAFIAISFLNSAYGFQNANTALSNASGGIYDAMNQIVWNKDFSDTSGFCVPASCSAGSATVTVTQNVPSVGFATIVSTATVVNYRRRIQAIISIHPTTGQVALISWNVL